MDTPIHPENTETTSDGTAALLRLQVRLASHPDLIPLMTKMPDLAEDALEGTPDAHQVEDQTAELMRELGTEVLGAWSQKAHDRAREEACRLSEELIVHRKKTSHGIAGSESSVS